MISCKAGMSILDTVSVGFSGRWLLLVVWVWVLPVG